MGTEIFAALRDVFKHNDFKSKLQKEAIECIHGGRLYCVYLRLVMEISILVFASVFEVGFVEIKRFWLNVCYWQVYKYN